ncbi:PHP domain-containing protein [Brachybacterium saurashtrense]|uniref:PHP domain-containing protein n=1 Tax=Brachybacterium saurashtrense TaxID=556288 RepID=A0A345YL82_9MICO|nr:PHP domain-containing protein [Brachybacterium saurashtrense]AXK44684.1 PHP domain-containing protein [Brachybacterium saurashtrense]RRR23296.1 PHP domain-containing protein [Brachybacterium saurashtrense]
MSERSDSPATQRIDLHSHSTCSDGTTSVPELFAQARAAGLDVLALTDHDTVEGWPQLPAAVAASGVAAVPGIEVSCEQGHRSVHLLALLVDPSGHTDLAAEMAEARSSRIERARRMVALIGEDHPVCWEDVLAQVAGEETVIGRPHIADALVAAGVVPDRSTAFTEILRPTGPYYVPYYAPSPLEAVAAIREAGGVSVIAHPGSVTRDDDLPVELLEELVEAGLDGVEVHHREHDDAERERLGAFAARHDLLVTGGSDFHGTGKPNRLGEHLTALEVLAEIERRATSGTSVLRP